MTVFADKCKAILNKVGTRIILTTVIYVVGIGVCVASLFGKGLDTIMPIYLVNAGVDLFGMIAGYILFVCYLIGSDSSESKSDFFPYLINITYVGLFSDALDGIIKEIPKWHVFLMINTTVYFMILPLECYFFFRYITATLKTKDDITRTIGRVLLAGLLLDLSIMIINVFTGIIFTVDSQGVYNRGPFYLCSYIYFIMAVILVIWNAARNREQLSKNQVLALSVFMGGPTLVAVLPDPQDGLSIMCGVIMAALIMSYCLVSIEQNQQQMIRKNELSMATSIQHTMLPHTFPAFPDRNEFDIFASMTPAKEVGGDFYDMFMVGDDELAVVIADVSGKGITAALFMAQSKQVIQSQLIICHGNVAEALAAANMQLIKTSVSDMFVTVWLGVITLSTGHMTFVDAGHEFPAVQRDQGAFSIEKDEHSMPVAALKRAKYRMNEIDLKPGDTVFLYTDGVTEAHNADGEMFGEQRLAAALNEARTFDVDKIDEHVRKRISEFVGEAEQYDDITTLCIRYFGKPE